MNEQTPRMGKPEAAMRLMQLACREGVREEEVIALQVGVRAIAKRHFDRGRNLARRAERKRAAHPDPSENPAPAGTNQQKQQTTQTKGKPMNEFEKLVKQMKEDGTEFDPNSVKDLQKMLAAVLKTGFSAFTKMKLATGALRMLMDPAKFGVEAAQKMRAESFRAENRPEDADRLEAAYAMLAKEWARKLEEAEKLLEALESGKLVVEVACAAGTPKEDSEGQPPAPAAETPAQETPAAETPAAETPAE